MVHCHIYTASQLQPASGGYVFCRRGTADLVGVHDAPLQQRQPLRVVPNRAGVQRFVGGRKLGAWQPCSGKNV
jgi:hypothetical protein